MATRQVVFGGAPERGVGWQDRDVQTVELPVGIDIPDPNLEDFDPLTPDEEGYIYAGNKGKTIYQRIWDKKEYADHCRDFVIAKLKTHEIKHIRVVESGDKEYGKEMLSVIDSAKTDTVLVGLDTEGGNAMCQIAVEGSRYVLIYQLSSATSSYCLENGQIPTNLIDSLAHFKALHAGKNVRSDLLSVGKMLKMSEGDMEKWQYVELQRILDFLYMLRYPEHLFYWVKAPLIANPLGATSLRFLHNVGVPREMLDKRGFHRNHKSDYKELKRQIFQMKNFIVQWTPRRARKQQKVWREKQASQWRCCRSMWGSQTANSYTSIALSVLLRPMETQAMICQNSMRWRKLS